MKSFTRIERSAFRHGEYVGYCRGAQRIVRIGDYWCTAGLRSTEGKAVSAQARTLELLNAELERIANTPSV